MTQRWGRLVGRELTSHTQNARRRSQPAHLTSDENLQGPNLRRPETRGRASKGARQTLRSEARRGQPLAERTRKSSACSRGHRKARQPNQRWLAASAQAALPSTLKALNRPSKPTKHPVQDRDGSTASALQTHPEPDAKKEVPKGFSRKTRSGRQHELGMRPEAFSLGLCQFEIAREQIDCLRPTQKASKALAIGHTIRKRKKSSGDIPNSVRSSFLTLAVKPYLRSLAKSSAGLPQTSGTLLESYNWPAPDHPPEPPEPLPGLHQTTLL